MPWESIRDDRGVARGRRGPSSRLGRRRHDPVDRDGDVRATTAGGHGSEQVPELLRHPLPWVVPSAPIIDVMSLRTGKRGPGAGSARWRTLPRRPLHLLSALPRTASRPVLCVRRRSGLVSWLETLVRHGDLEVIRWCAARSPGRQVAWLRRQATWRPVSSSDRSAGARGIGRAVGILDARSVHSRSCARGATTGATPSARHRASSCSAPRPYSYPGDQLVTRHGGAEWPSRRFFRRFPRWAATSLAAPALLHPSN